MLWNGHLLVTWNNSELRELRKLGGDQIILDRLLSWPNLGVLCAVPCLLDILVRITAVLQIIGGTCQTSNYFPMSYVHFKDLVRLLIIARRFCSPLLLEKLRKKWFKEAEGRKKWVRYIVGTTEAKQLIEQEMDKLLRMSKGLLYSRTVDKEKRW